MLSICEITKVAPCGFLATSLCVLYTSFPTPDSRLHLSGGGRRTPGQGPEGSVRSRGDLVGRSEPVKGPPDPVPMAPSRHGRLFSDKDC